MSAAMRLRKVQHLRRDHLTLLNAVKRSAKMRGGMKRASVARRAVRSWAESLPSVDCLWDTQRSRTRAVNEGGRW